jgi:hypothetical protein
MRRVVIGLVAFLMCSSRCALAWNDTGHMTVALIAWRQLDDASKQKVAAILKRHPHYELYLTQRLPEGVSADEWSFLRASTWPDFVRPGRAGVPGETYKGPEITQYHKGPWHYIDLPWVPWFERDKINATTLPSREEPNILTALDGVVKDLQSADKTESEKAIALAWLEHLCGDIHQPLHACTEWSTLYPAGDKGGNDQAVRAAGMVMRLHAFWDDVLGTSDAYDALAFDADHILNQPALAKEKIVELAKDTTFSSWADESHRWGISMAHLNGRLRSVPFKEYESKHVTAEEVPALAPSYLVNAHELAELRVAMAGYRLAEQIKQVLSK